MAAAVLSQHEIGADKADVLGTHDLVGGPLLEHAVLVDARLVCEGVLADDRLVPLDFHPRDIGDEVAGGVEPRLVRMPVSNAK